MGEHAGTRTDRNCDGAGIWTDVVLRLRAGHDSDAGLRPVLPATSRHRDNCRGAFRKQPLQVRPDGATGKLAGHSEIRLAGSRHGDPWRGFSNVLRPATSLLHYTIAGTDFEVTAVKAIIGSLIVLFALLELSPQWLI